MMKIIKALLLHFMLINIHKHFFSHLPVTFSYETRLGKFECFSHDDVF
jgi:hypothetical protein